MKELKFDPYKSKDSFYKNYKLHDKAQFISLNLLIQWGVKFRQFGEDNRFQKLWEKGGDKPDFLILYKDRRAFLEIKSKRSSKFIINERAVKSYKTWSEVENLPALIVFVVFDAEENISEIKLASAWEHSLSNKTSKQWDLNNTLAFNAELPSFTKSNLIKLMDNRINEIF